jgi:glycosyltransferase involved in cell wall biosynthesis
VEEAGRWEISAVLPAYNEAGELPAVAAELMAALARVAARFEIIIVDDGSRDDTVERAEKLAANDPRVRLVRHPRNRGYGAALRSGFAAAQYEWIFFTDADGQFIGAELPLLTARAPERDFIAGYRAVRSDPWQRRLYGRMFSALIRALFGVKARDVNCAFKLFKKGLLPPGGLTSEGALINAELLAAARARGVDPLEVPVSHRPRRSGRPTGGSPRVIARAVAELVRLRLRS